MENLVNEAFNSAELITVINKAYKKEDPSLTEEKEKLMKNQIVKLLIITRSLKLVSGFANILVPFVTSGINVSEETYNEILMEYLYALFNNEEVFQNVTNNYIKDGYSRLTNPMAIILITNKLEVSPKKPNEAERTYLMRLIRNADEIKINLENTREKELILINYNCGRKENNEKYQRR